MSGTRDATAFPAPGSAVRGAPPPLKRALTAADGVPDASPPDRSADAAQSLVAQGISDTPPPATGGSRLVAAAAMLGIATGLEIAGVMSRRRDRWC